MTESEKNREREKIEMMVLEGLHSGEGIEITPQMWDELRQKLRGGAQARSKDSIRRGR